MLTYAVERHFPPKRRAAFFYMMYPNSILAAFVFVLGIASVTYGWTGPTASAPNGNVAAPINVGSTQQIKDGVLGVGGLVVFGNSVLAADGGVTYLNFVTASGGTGYGLRDRAGTKELKNANGSW